MNQTPPSAGEFDPVRATIYKPNRAETESKEPTFGEPIVVCQRHIKGPRRLYVREQTTSSKAESLSNQVIEVRRDRITETITSDFWFTHRGLDWQIVGRLEGQWARDMILFQVVSRNDPEPAE